MRTVERFNFNMAAGGLKVKYWFIKWRNVN